MKIHELAPAYGATTTSKRVGRGIGSGLGKTAGKGHKGQKARTGGKIRRGFEGGQTPLYRRLPKRGFKNHFAKEYAVVNLSDLEKFENGTTVNAELLLSEGIIRKELDGVKVLGNGTLTKKLENIKQIFSVKDIRKKLLFTFAILLLFRIGTFITIPGLDKITINQQLGAGSNGLTAMINLISGGAFSRLSIFSMTIGPYITASIVLNLLQFVIPSLERLAKEGENGRKKLGKYTKYLTIAFALIEGLGLYFTYRAYLLAPLTYGAGKVLGLFLFLISLMAGTSLLTWLGDKITEYGIGNGISMIVFFGIVAGLPTTIRAFWNLGGAGFTGILVFALLMVGLIAVITGVVFVQKAERRIPVNYAKRVVGRKMYGGQSTHIPIKLAMAGVMPLIFAMSFMSFPSIIISLVTDTTQLSGFWGGVYKLFTASQGSHWGYLLGYAVIYMALIIVFTFVYTMFIINPVEIANNLKKNGGFIPGIRAGKNTSDYINNVLIKITAAGSLFLAAIAILPIILQAFTSQSVSFSGNSILILVSVGLEVLTTIEAQMVSRNYSGFLG